MTWCRFGYRTRNVSRDEGLQLDAVGTPAAARTRDSRKGNPRGATLRGRALEGDAAGGGPFVVRWGWLAVHAGGLAGFRSADVQLVEERVHKLSWEASAERRWGMWEKRT